MRSGFLLAIADKESRGGPARLAPASLLEMPDPYQII